MTIKKQLSLVLLLLFMLSLVACASTKQSNREDAQTNVEDSPQQPSFDNNESSMSEDITQEEDTEEENTSYVDATGIEVDFEKDYINEEKLHLSVIIHNKTEGTFSGKVCVSFYSADKKICLGSDTIELDSLFPGYAHRSGVDVLAYNGNPKMTVSLSDVSFAYLEEEPPEVDTVATEKTLNSFRFNFDGVSWYSDITEIVVYSDGCCVATVGNNTEEDGQFYASVIWSCGNKYGVKTVTIVNASGAVLYTY